MDAKRKAWVNYWGWFMSGMLLLTTAGMVLGSAAFGLIGLAGLLIGALVGGQIAASKRNAPRWLTGCIWIGGGMLLGGPAGAMIGAALPVTMNWRDVSTMGGGI